MPHGRHAYLDALGLDSQGGPQGICTLGEQRQQAVRKALRQALHSLQGGLQPADSMQVFGSFMILLEALSHCRVASGLHILTDVRQEMAEGTAVPYRLEYTVLGQGKIGLDLHAAGFKGHGQWPRAWTCVGTQPEQQSAGSSGAELLTWVAPSM